MGTQKIDQTTGQGSRWHRPLQGVLLAAILSGTTGCLFSGGPAEDEIDPKEATAREANYRSDAEKARDSRFGDRRKRRADLSEPVRSKVDPPND